MVSFSHHATDADATRAVGYALGLLVNAGDYICLHGDLGAGKTTLVQGLALGLGVTDKYITSPSFALVNEYRGRFTLYHIDLYRLAGPEDLDDIGFPEYPGEGVAAVEWPERAGGMLPAEMLEIFIEYADDGGRDISFRAAGQHYEKLLDGLWTELGK
ncbi:MAG TPA: tRNA (adenosine(37)-N6)-threonylcarbamoyltransferase complex ATPase subunit type 1 TsaE [Nitrospirota bacterium]|jgi:tRNA threonylcarbamoyladenosine biosynthesis protein TsaE